MQRGSIEHGEGGWLVSFRLPGEPIAQNIAAFSDLGEAQKAYDLLVLRAAADVAPAGPPQLHRPLEVGGQP